MTSATHHILGAAGHVDHGKTALIHALTGTNTDRLKEEQERGISIELGFAELTLADGTVLGVVDMPGHERFIKQMVAGAGGVDLALLVVAADEGVMPQTVEHLEILQALDVHGGVAVLAKADTVDAELVAVVHEEVAELVAGTFLEGKPIVATSVVDGRGLDELRAALAAEAAALSPRRQDGPFRLPVDRVFTMPGVGAVVTGTCWSGRVSDGDRLLLEPGSRKIRVREVQVHGRRVAAAGSGQRVALAMHGVKKEDLERGDQVVAPDAATVCRRIDLRVDLFRHYTGEIVNRQRLHVHHAGREVLGRIVPLDTERLGGEGGPRTGLCQLHLEEPLVARSGDRLVLRFYSPVVSMAGGVVLEVDPRAHRRFDAEALEALEVREQGDPEALFQQQLEAVGLVGLEIAAAGGRAVAANRVVVGTRIVARRLLEAEARAVGELIEGYARTYPLRVGMPKEEVRRRRRFPGSAAEWSALCQAMAPYGGWTVLGDRIAVGPEGPPLSPALAAVVAGREAALRAAGLAWPGTAALAAVGPALPSERGREVREEEILRYLVDRGRAVQIATDYFVHNDNLATLIERLRAHFTAASELDFATFRELSGLTRKLGIPLLEYCDAAGITERVGDVRRAGPRLSAGNDPANRNGATRP
jgi:selenocysteine-specific elongation factor